MNFVIATWLFKERAIPRRQKFWLSSVFLAASMSQNAAVAEQVVEASVVYEKGDEDAASIMQILKRKLEKVRFRHLTIDDLGAAKNWCAGRTVVIAVGEAATTEATKNCSGTIVTSKVGRDFPGLLASEGTTQAKIIRIGQAASIIHQIRLAKYMSSERAGKIYLVHSEASRQEVHALLKLLDENTRTKVETLAVASPEILVKLLKDPAENAAAFVFTDESTVIDSYNIRALMIMSARAGVPLFGGAAPEMVSAGFTGGVYYTIPVTAELIINKIKAIGGEKVAAADPKPQPEINVRLAKRYKLRIDDLMNYSSSNIGAIPSSTDAPLLALTPASRP